MIKKRYNNAVIIIIKNLHDYSDTISKTLQGHFTKITGIMIIRHR